jgi:hypothetical protein
MAKVLRPLVCVSILLTLLSANGAFAQQNTATKRNTASPVKTGIYRGRRVTYQIVNGRMITEGDIALEHVDQKLPETGVQPGATLDYLKYLWLKNGSVYQIPYMIDPASGDVSNINSAVSTYNSLLAGVIQWVPYTNQTDYVDFDLTDTSGSGEGFSYIGRVGGKQIIGGATNCTVATLLHEMGHATGFWHEQQRPDRNNYVSMNFNNMITTTYPYSLIQYDDMQALTLYDWGSIMEYFPDNFTKNGNPVIETIPPGMPLANYVGYTVTDLDAIKRLYGAAPTEVTIATNPPGLQVIVDGVTVTTPQTYNWPLFSTHTLDVASTVQTQTGNIAGTTTSTTFYYTYGRWNDNGAQNHTITVLPGNNELAFPATSPAVTVYTASFIQLVPYTNAAYPTGTGTIVPTPAPQSYSGVSGVYYVARQQVTLTATPSSGQNFYQYIDSPYWVEGGLSANPKTFLVPDTGDPLNFTTYFVPTSYPIYTLDSNPDGSRFYIQLDGPNYWPAPTSFSPYYDSGWNAGKTHTITVSNPEYPWTLNTGYNFVSWSDGGALSHTITVPSTSTAYTATLQPTYYVTDYSNEGTCAGSVTPAGNTYYTDGSSVTFTATPSTGWVFTQWEQNLSGTTNPQTVTVSDEITGIADFNTISTPFTVASLSPSAAVAGSAGLTLTINGTGFTTGTVVIINSTSRTIKFINSGQITVSLTSLDLATPGGFQVFVENFPPGATCAAFGALPFNVASAPIVTPSPLNLTFAPQLVGTTSAAKTVMLKNTSASSVTMNSITATGDYAITSNTCGSSLASGGSCSVQLTFTPSVSGSVPGSLSISDSAPDSPQTVALTGTGNLPLTITPPMLAFGTVNVGTTSPSKTITLTNNESSTLAYSFSASGNYAVSSTGTTCTGSLASKAKCNIAVTLTPTAAGTINGALAISDSSTFSPQLVTLSGTGSGGSTPPLTFTPTTLTFAPQAVGTTSAGKTVTVKNTSASGVTLSSLATSGDFTATGSGTTPCAANLNLAAGASCTMSVTFSPALGASGSISGAVVVSDNASVSQQVFDVKGTAALPISFSPTSLTFGAQAVATTSGAQTVTLTNNLATSLSPTITGSGEFAVAPGGTTPCTGTLAAHAKCTITVTFTPHAVGTRASAITVTDSSNPGVETMAVTGTGQ